MIKRMQKLSLWTIVILIFCQTMLNAQTIRQIRHIPDYSDINSIYSPRDDGSRNESRLIDYITKFCSDRSIDCRTDRIIGEDYCSLSSNVIVTLGNTKSRDNIIYITPLDSIISETNTYDNSISIHIMLKLIEQTANNVPTDKHVTFLFAGASGYTDQPYYGLNHFINRTAGDFSDNRDFSSSFITIIDILSTGTTVYLKGDGGSYICETASQIYSSIHRSSDIVELDVNRRQSSNISKNSLDYTSAFGDLTTSIVLFTNRDNAGFNDFVFSAEYQSSLDEFFISWHDKLAERTFQFQHSDNYIFLRLFGKNVIIPENILLLFLCICVFILITVRLLLPNIRRMSLSMSVVIALRFLPLLPAYYIVSFIPYIISLAVGSIFSNTTAYLNIYFIYLLVVFFVSAQIFFLIRDRYPKLYMLKHSYIFTSASIIYSFINMFIFGSIDVMLMFIYLWAIFMITCSNFTGRNYIVKFIFYILSAAVYISFTAFSLPHYLHSLSDRMAYEFSHIWIQNAVLVISTFPFMLIYMRLDSFAHNHIHFFSRRGLYRLILLILSVSYIIIIFAAANVARQDNSLTTVTLFTDVPNEDSVVSIDSIGKLGKVFITDPTGNTSADITSQHWTKDIAFQRAPYQINVTTTPSGTFTVYTIDFTFDRPVKFSSMTLIMPKGYYPFDSSYTLLHTEMHNSAESADQDCWSLRLPRNLHYQSADNAVTFSVLSGVAFDATLTFEFYDAPDFAIDFPNEDIKVRKKFIWEDSIKFQ